MASISGGEATTLNNIGGVYSALGEKQRALEHYEQALPLRRQVGDRGEIWVLDLDAFVVEASMVEEMMSSIELRMSTDALVNVMSTEEAAEKHEAEAGEVIQTFCEQLDVDEDVAEILDDTHVVDRMNYLVQVLTQYLFFVLFLAALLPTQFVYAGEASDEVLEMLEAQGKSMRHHLDQLNKNVDDLLWYHRVGDVAVVDKVRIYGPPKWKEEHPDGIGAGSTCVATGCRATFNRCSRVAAACCRATTAAAAIGRPGRCLGALD